MKIQRPGRCLYSLLGQNHSMTVKLNYRERCANEHRSRDSFAENKFAEKHVRHELLGTRKKARQYKHDWNFKVLFSNLHKIKRFICLELAEDAHLLSAVIHNGILNYGDSY